MKKGSSTKKVVDPFENVYIPPLTRTVNAIEKQSEWSIQQEKKRKFRAQYTIENIDLIRINRTI